MKPEEIAALGRLCPEAAELKTVHQKWVDYFRNDDDLIKAVDQTIAAIAACIVRLGEDGMRMAMECGEATGHLKFLRTVCDMSEIPADTLAEIDKLLNRKERG